jgi:ParB family transcriptional regulator, chromosome partitioning protein
MTEFREINLLDINVPETHREANPEKVKRLAEGIERVGLQHPITVRRVVDRGAYWKTELVSGRHRLEAVRLLGHRSILAMVIEADDTKARLLEISENLHRNDLTALERLDQVAEWIRLTEAKATEVVSAQVAKTPRRDT